MEGFHEVTDIDRRSCTRVVPMRAICAGLPRTGTLSLRAAMKRLGFEDTYHMASAAYENKRDCEMWIDAIRAKVDGEGTFGKEDWDRLLGHCQAVADFPCTAFVPELVKAYPEAKVVLNTRDVDTWHVSVTNTINIVMKEIRGKDCSDDSIDSQKMLMMLRLWDYYWDGDFENKGKELFKKHYERVREIVPAENLLEYRVQDGWEPLCKFLGVPVPDEPFPRMNDTATFTENAKKLDTGNAEAAAAAK